jgi:site-specific recombinase XerD
MLDNFKSYLTNTKGNSDKTISAYSTNTENYFKYLNQPLSILVREHILQYKNNLQYERNMNAKSINQILSSLKSYNEYLIVNNFQQSMVILSMDYIKIQKQLTSPTTTSTKEAIIFMNKKVKTNEPLRNYHIVHLILNSGLRISELVNIKLTNIYLNKKKLIVIGKGNKQREIPLNDEAIKTIKEAIDNRATYKYSTNSPYLFISSKGIQLNTFSVERIFNKYSKTITPHTLRHIFATNFLESGGDIRTLQQILGHVSLETTMIYTHPSEEKMMRDVNMSCIG